MAPWFSRIVSTTSKLSECAYEGTIKLLKGRKALDINYIQNELSGDTQMASSRQNLVIVAGLGNLLKGAGTQCLGIYQWRRNFLTDIWE